jgi:hypothetical protein
MVTRRIRALIQKHRKVRMSPGEMRYISGIDIFRANVMWLMLRDNGSIVAPSTVQQYLTFDGSVVAASTNASPSSPNRAASAGSPS